MYIYIYTKSQKLEYMLKLATLVYALICNVSWICKHKD